MAWRATVLTIFPEMFPGPLGSSLAGKALTEGKWALEAIDIRGFATDKHRSVDDATSCGVAGMVMRAHVRAVGRRWRHGDAGRYRRRRDRRRTLCNACGSSHDLSLPARLPIHARTGARACGRTRCHPALRPLRRNR